MLISIDAPPSRFVSDDEVAILLDILSNEFPETAGILCTTPEGLNAHSANRKD